MESSDARKIASDSCINCEQRDRGNLIRTVALQKQHANHAALRIRINEFAAENCDW